MRDGVTQKKKGDIAERIENITLTHYDLGKRRFFQVSGQADFHMSSNKRDSLLLMLMVILLCIQVALSFGLVLKLNGISQMISYGFAERRDTGQALQVPEYVEDVSVDDDPALGVEDAPVVIIEFSDYECPFCAQTVSLVRTILSDNAGKVKYVLRDFPLQTIHPHAFKAAEAANCAGEQGKFWEMHDLLFEKQAQLDTTSLKGYAARLQIDINQFEDCLDSGEYVDEIRHDIEEGKKYYVNGTPTFFVNGHRLAGPSLEQLQQAIDLALEEVR